MQVEIAVYCFPQRTYETPCIYCIVASYVN